MTDFNEEELYYWREGEQAKIDNVDRWFWLKTDSGAWDGPKVDWQSHKKFIQEHVKKYDVVVQAGGCQGMYPRLLSDMFKTVYTFEFSPKNYYALVRNCPQENIIKINAAIGDSHGLVSIKNMNETNVGVHSVSHDDNNSFIPQLMIDDLALRHCDLIMLDIEGYEETALKGAINTLNKFKPVVFAENGQKAAEFMKSIGYNSIGNSCADTIYLPEM